MVILASCSSSPSEIIEKEPDAIDVALEHVRHYYDSADFSQFGIDEMAMVYLLDQHGVILQDDALEVIDTVHGNDPFKRLVDASGGVEKISLIPLDKFDGEKRYDLSSYSIEGAEGVSFDQWDDVLIKALYCDRLGYTYDDFDRLVRIYTDYGGYDDTHIAIGLHLLEENGCYDIDALGYAKEDLIASIIVAQESDSFDDLYAERIAVLYWLGHGDLVQKEWIDEIVLLQNDDGGWGNGMDEPSNPHTTGLAALSLVYYREGKGKQSLYSG